MPVRVKVHRAGRDPHAKTKLFTWKTISWTLWRGVSGYAMGKATRVLSDDMVYPVPGYSVSKWVYPERGCPWVHPPKLKFWEVRTTHKVKVVYYPLTLLLLFRSLECVNPA